MRLKIQCTDVLPILTFGMSRYTGTQVHLEPSSCRPSMISESKVGPSSSISLYHDIEPWLEGATFDTSIDGRKMPMTFDHDIGHDITTRYRMFWHSISNAQTWNLILVNVTVDHDMIEGCNIRYRSSTMSKNLRYRSMEHRYRLSSISKKLRYRSS